jgi:hypothetical protein
MRDRAAIAPPNPNIKETGAVIANNSNTTKTDL